MHKVSSTSREKLPVCVQKHQLTAGFKLKETIVVMLFAAAQVKSMAQ